MNTQIVILAAGKGTRMEESHLPKVLLKLKGQPVIAYLLNELKKLKDLPKPVIVVGYKSKQVKEILGNGYIYAVQKQQLGTAHAVWSARKQVTASNILVLYGDVPFIKTGSLKKLINLHVQNKCKLSMFTTFIPNFEGKFSVFNALGRIIRDKFSNIVKITEYKDATPQERKINELNPGIYMFNTQWLWNNIDKINNKNAQGEFYLTDIVEVAIDDGLQICSSPIGFKEILGVNTKRDLVQLEKITK